MQTGCVFCEVVAGTRTASLVYERPSVIAFMDLRQFNPGHVLVVPRRHIATIFDLDDETGTELMAAMIRIARAVREAFEPDGINITQSNGEAAGQEIFHLHFHVHPRRAGDKMMHYAPVETTAPADLDRLAQRVREALEAH